MYGLVGRFSKIGYYYAKTVITIEKRMRWVSRSKSALKNRLSFMDGPLRLANGGVFGWSQKQPFVCGLIYLQQ